MKSITSAYKVLSFLLYYEGVNHQRKVIECYGDKLIVQTLPFAMRVLGQPQHLFKHITDLINLGFITDFEKFKGYFTCRLARPHYDPSKATTSLDMPINVNTIKSNASKDEASLMVLPVKQMIKEYGLPLDFRFMEDK